MNDFKKFCIDEKLSPVQIVGARKAWQEQQAIIDNLKAQLNNMEACYIEKKKECEELQGKSQCIKSLVEQRNLAENMLRKISVAAQKKLPTFGAALRFNDEVKEILRGANDSLIDTRQKAEDQINNGARLTKHQIDL